MGAPGRKFVQRRAGERCEYCKLPQEFSELHFHVEHVIPGNMAVQTMLKTWPWLVPTVTW